MDVTAWPEDTKDDASDWTDKDEEWGDKDGTEEWGDKDGEDLETWCAENPTSEYCEPEASYALSSVVALAVTGSFLL